MILTIRTDKPEAELGLYDAIGKQITYQKWQAHRQLSETIHRKIDGLLATQGLVVNDISGIVFYEGPGSFTGLRIGAAVANGLASGLGVIVASTGGSDWISKGVANIQGGSGKSAAPFYDSDAKTTTQKK